MVLYKKCSIDRENQTDKKSTAKKIAAYIFETDDEDEENVLPQNKENIET